MRHTVMPPKFCGSASANPGLMPLLPPVIKGSAAAEIEAFRGHACALCSKLRKPGYIRILESVRV